MKVFIGCQLTPPLQLQLAKSSAWKEAMIGESSPEDLQQVRYEGMEFIGFYSSSPALAVEKVLDLQERVCDEIARYCPKYERNKLHPKIFSQVFVS